MIITADVETIKVNNDGKGEYILDATGKYFKLGCLLKDSGKEVTFLKKEDMWNYIIKLGESELKRGRKLTVYFHNARYDFYNIANIKDKGIRWFCENPFIAGYYKEIVKVIKDKEGWERYAKFNNVYYKYDKNEKGELVAKYNKEIIKFLDTLAIYRMSLKKMGDIIGFPKIEMPDKLGELDYYKMKELEMYCQNDCKIVMEGIKFLKKKLREDNLNIRNLCTINQVAISYIINKLKEDDAKEMLVKNKNDEITEVTYKTRFPEEIHSSYRGGTVRVWKTGFFDELTSVDCNSLYPYIIMNMDVPDLRTEKMIKQPKKSILKSIGISKVMLYNKSCKIGLIPVRMQTKAYVPKVGKYMIGIWTNKEISKALEEGYELIDIEWSIVWEKGKNYFKKIYGDLYNRRITGDGKFNYWFYKEIMNRSIGKFGQFRVNQELFIDSVGMAEEYLKNNIKVIRGIDKSTDLIYSKTVSAVPKKYYAPIIPALVTAGGRIHMYDEFKKVPYNKLVYSDTDSIISEGDYRSKLKMGLEVGDFKEDKDIVTGEKLVNKKGIIWGTKAKSIGNNIALSGAFKGDLTLEDFEKGTAKSQRLIGIKGSRTEEVGKLIIEERDLKKQNKDFWESERILEEQVVYVDCDMKDISFFMKDLEDIDVTHGLI